MNLIIQGSDVATSDLKQLAYFSASAGIEKIAPGAFRLVGANAETQPAVRDYCVGAQLDFAFVDAAKRLGDFGLVVMDMDSTLISIECIDEIADMLGIKAGVAAITAAAMRGEIEFAESVTRRVALLKGLDQSALEKVYAERLKLNPGAEKMLARMRQAGVKAMLVSGGFTFFTERLKARLGLDYAAANTLEIAAGKLTGKLLGNIIDAQAKADLLVATRDKLGLKPKQVIAIGDGANDLKMLAAAGVGIAYHAKPIVRAQTTYALNHVGLDGVTNLFAD